MKRTENDLTGHAPRHPRRPRALAAVAAAAVLVAGAGVAVALTARHPAHLSATPDARSRPIPPPARNPLLPPAGVLFGALVQPAVGYTSVDQEASIASFERVIGRRLAVASLYTSWSAPMPVALARWDLRGGRIPMISWADGGSANVVGGLYDRQIRAQADQLKALRGPVLLRLFPEMNNSFLASTVGSPAMFIAAWRHVYKIFKVARATNVQWAWCPTSVGFSAGTAERFYPGQDYVNWIGADGYNWALRSPGGWRSFATIFSAFYRWAEDKRKPLFVGEFGSGEGSPGAKANWFRQAGQQLRTLFPRIRAVIYFNAVHMNFGLMFDWRVDSSPSALAAFRSVVRDPYFSARPKT